MIDEQVDAILKHGPVSAFSFNLIQLFLDSQLSYSEDLTLNIQTAFSSTPSFAERNETAKEQSRTLIQSLLNSSNNLPRDSIARGIQEQSFLISSLYSSTPLESLLNCDLAIMQTGCPHYSDKFTMIAIVCESELTFTTRLPRISVEAIVTNNTTKITTHATLEDQTILSTCEYKPCHELIEEIETDDDFIDSFHSRTPCVFRSFATYPALDKWCDLNYLVSAVGAYRSVPVEHGRDYDSKEFSVKLMHFHLFISKHYLASSKDSDGADSTSTSIGYMAQHDLTSQSKSLLEDFSVPDLIYYTGCDAVKIRFWIGPCGTFSPRHCDPEDNLFVGVVGFKSFFIYTTEKNSDDACVERVREVLVGPGDLLFIPVRLLVISLIVERRRSLCSCVVCVYQYKFLDDSIKTSVLY